MRKNKIELTDQVKDFVLANGVTVQDTEAAVQLSALLGKEVNKVDYARLRTKLGVKRKRGRPRKENVAAPVTETPLIFSEPVAVQSDDCAPFDPDGTLPPVG